MRNILAKPYLEGKEEEEKDNLAGLSPLYVEQISSL